MSNEGTWVLGGIGGRVVQTPQEYRDSDTMCGWMCDEVEERSCPNMGLPCNSRWDHFERPLREIVQTWTFVESSLAAGLGVLSYPLAPTKQPDPSPPLQPEEK